MDELELHKRELQKQINNHTVLQSELTQLKPNAKVYRKQENSDIFFSSHIEKELHTCKDTLDSLVKEYEDLEKPLTTKIGEAKSIY